MDNTDRVALRCPLSKWDGNLETCRRCSRKLTGRSWKWCGKYCSRLFQQNHSYRKARRAARQASRIKCGCPKVRSHISCPRCGLCEGKAKIRGIKFEMNHITPVVGDSTVYRQYSCLNHQDLLENLCYPCHLATTAQQKMDRHLAKQRSIRDR